MTRVEIAGFFVVTILVVWFVWSRKRRRIRPYNRLVRQFLRRVALSSGQEPTHAVGLMELAERSGDVAALEFARLYAGALYRDRDLTRDELLELRRLLKQIG